MSPSPIKARVGLPRGTYKSKAEEAYAWHLEVSLRAGQIADWRYEPITLKLGGDTRYTPDFLVIHLDGSVEFQEVKGHMRDAARVKLRVAASMYQVFDFTIIWAMHGKFRAEKVNP